jgi:hypothetical protein
MLAPKTDLVVRIENEDAIILKCVEDYSGNWVRGLGRLFTGVECESLNFPDSLGPLYLETTSLWGDPFVDLSMIDEGSLAGRHGSTDSLDSAVSGPSSSSYSSSKHMSVAAGIPIPKTENGPRFSAMVSGSPGALLTGGGLLTSASNSPTHHGAPALSNAIIKSGMLDKEVRSLFLSIQSLV